uniref:Uncharacterized protein n=1 Tax=Rhizophora mucronata TaxID=61149 RepID=A0A2P2N7D9_RHIMU
MWDNYFLVNTLSISQHSSSCWSMDGSNAKLVTKKFILAPCKDFIKVFATC